MVRKRIEKDLVVIEVIQCGNVRKILGGKCYIFMRCTTFGVITITRVVLKDEYHLGWNLIFTNSIFFPFSSKRLSSPNH